MRAAAPRSPTTLPVPVASPMAFRRTVARHTETLKSYLRQARARTSAAQSVEWTRNIAKAVLSSLKCKAVEMLVALVVDAARRADAPEHAEQVGLHLAAIARSEWAASHPERGPRLSVREAHILEERYEGVCDEAEAQMAHEPTLAHRMRYLAASAELARARQMLDDAVRREVATTGA